MAGFENDIGFAKNFDFTQADNQAPTEANGLVTNGQFWIGRTAVNAGGTHIDVGTISAGTGITVTNGPGTISIASTASLTDLHVARFIVASSTSGTGANYTTIASAITAAVATGINSTIFLQPGTYTENFTLPANINICAFECDAFTPNVTIVGTITKTTAGSSSISGVRLQTNGAALLAVTGSAASVINLNNSYLNCTNATGITYSSSSASSSININNCKGDTGTTGIAYFAHSSAGTLDIRNTFFTNSGGSSTACTCSAGVCNINQSNILNPVTLSGTAAGTFVLVLFSNLTTNSTSFTAGGSGIQQFRYCRFSSGTASAFSVSTTASLDTCEVDSTNAAAVTGAGTINYGPITFTNTSNIINTTTQTALVANYGINKSSLQPSFLATASLQSDVTGDGTVYTILYANEIFDQNSNFASPTFTAPYTGRYQFNVTTSLSGLTASHTSGSISLVASNRTIIGLGCNWGAVMTVGTIARLGFSATIDMDAADTCTVTINIANGTKVVDIGADNTTFSGFLQA